MIQNELFYQKRHQPGIKETITTGHLKITLGGSQISIGRKQAKKAAESPRKGYALLFFQMCPKRIIKKEGSPKVRSPEPWGTMELPPGSRNRPTQGIPRALGREPSRLSNKISELICTNDGYVAAIFPPSKWKAVSFICVDRKLFSQWVARSRGTKSRPEEETKSYHKTPKFIPDSMTG